MLIFVLNDLLRKMNTDKGLLPEEKIICFDWIQRKIINSDFDGCVFKKCCEKYKKASAAKSARKFNNAVFSTQIFI